MPHQANEEMLNAIGQQVANLLGRPPNDVFVFILAGDAWQEVAVFDNQPGEVIYHDGSDEMFDTVSDLWDAAEPERKWFMLHYDIKDGRFDAKYYYPDEFGFSFNDPVIDPDDPDFDPDKLDDTSESFRDDALAERYGDKPIRYPPEEDFYELTEDDLKRD